MLAMNAAGEADCHAQPHFGNRQRKHPAGREHMDAALKAGLVIDIGQEIGLDVENGFQLGSLAKTLCVHRLLAHQDFTIRQMAVVEGISIPTFEDCNIMLMQECCIVLRTEHLFRSSGCWIIDDLHYLSPAIRLTRRGHMTTMRHLNANCYGQFNAVSGPARGNRFFGC